MIESFRDDFFWMLREGKGYFPWVKEHPYRMLEYLFGKQNKGCFKCCERQYSVRDLVKSTLEEGGLENPLFDLVMKALIRAEIRLISRFIPQRSHEERLTGSLVSEIDNAFSLVRPVYKACSIKHYSVEKNIDFLYYDMSRGGSIEKETGADLGFVVVVDLPDYPFIVKSIYMQAKKISYNSVQLDRTQYESLIRSSESAAYLIYDMNLERRTSPMVISVDKYCIKSAYEESVKNKTNSFSVSIGDILSNGLPLSLFLSCFGADVITSGEKHDSFENAFYSIKEMLGKKQTSSSSNARVAMVSIGRSIRISVPNNEGLMIDI